MIQKHSDICRSAYCTLKCPLFNHFDHFPAWCKHWS
nr:MAG TPA: hypothetical protein [Caudoviricetes sp.]